MVASVSIANGLPLDPQSRQTRVAGDGDAVVRAHTTRVSPGYLDTMRIPLLRGRGITSDDQTGSEPVVVITRRWRRVSSRTTSRLAHGSGLRWTAAMPRSIRGGLIGRCRRGQTFTVVGVTADLVDAYLGPPEPQLFVPLAQHPTPQVYVIARSSAARPR